METIVIKEPIYEMVKKQIGERDKIVYITSDGQQFDNEKSADYHEFYNLKVKKRYYGLDGVNIFNCESWGDIQKYLDEYGYGINVHDYNKDLLEFPNTYVLSEEEEVNEDYGYDKYGQPNEYETYLRIYTLEEFKNKIVKELDDLDI